MLSVSILGIKEKELTNYKKLDDSTCDYVHLDIMDGIFVPNTNNYNKGYKFNKKIDIHLMVKDIYKYINLYKELNPEYITFHLEATNNPIEIINYIKNLNIKVGISIKPNTDLNLLLPYLQDINLVLVMSVEPGYGGQKFIYDSINKIDELYKIRIQNNYNYLIEVDGGINNQTIKYVNKADIKVVGSYITNYEDYQNQIDTLKL